MSKRAYISRYLLILKKLKAKPYSSYKELKDYIANEFDYLQVRDDRLKLSFSKRTFERDKKEISNVFGIDIEHSRVNKGYFISQNETENMNFQRMMEAFEVINALNFTRDNVPFIHLEKRKPQGTENLYGLLHAIKNKVQIKFSYQKFWEEEPTHRLTEPYSLKEFKNRWYLLAKDSKGSNIKSFCLDRLSNLEITRKKFEFPKTYNVEESYRYCFGIISPDDDEPQQIVLSFNAFQGKYIKSLPLHETQQVLVDNKNELQIKLKLFVTHDFIMELLSFGDNMKVLKPKSLMNRIKAEHQKAFKQY